MAEKFLEMDPPYLDPEYAVTKLRAPLRPAVIIPGDWFEKIGGPVFASMKVTPEDSDLTRQHSAEPIGERIIVFGRVTDSDGRPIRRHLIEIWQANASGRYIDPVDLWGLPLDPNFSGMGRCLTDGDGMYRFVTIRPAAYPTFYTPGVKAWRASHIHFSIFGIGFESRLITQMYFEGDPLLSQDRMFVGIADKRGRERLLGRFDPDASFIDVLTTANSQSPMDNTGRLVTKDMNQNGGAKKRSETAIAYRFDIVLRGGGATPIENQT